MSKMDQSQRRYVANRVKEIQKLAEDLLRDKHTKPGKALTDKEKNRLILRGETELKQHLSKCTINTKLDDAIDWSWHEPEEEFNDKEFNKDNAKLIKECTAVTDAAILKQDPVEALMLLKELEKKYL